MDLCRGRRSFKSFKPCLLYFLVCPSYASYVSRVSFSCRKILILGSIVCFLYSYCYHIFSLRTFYKTVLNTIASINISMRLERLDIFRGFAIVLMILFHLNYSLVHIFNSEILNISESFWYLLGRVSALSFIFTAGFSYFLAERKYADTVKIKYLKYSFILAIFAGTISIGTYILFPEQFIAFGIIHFFALSFFFLPWITKLWYGVFFLGGSIIIYGISFIPIVQNPFLFPFGFRTIDFYSADYYPLFPYFWVLLLGYVCWLLAEKYALLHFLHISRNTYFWEKLLIYLGKKSLLLYLIHQPIVIGVVYIWILYFG